MSSLTIGIIGLIVFVVLMLIGLPIGVSMGLVGFFGYAVIVNFNGAFGMVKGVLYSTASSYSMVVIPLFILMGFFCYYSELSSNLYDFAHKMIGHRSGGLAMGTVFACGLFAAICGSSPATTSAFGSVCLPEMQKRGYSNAIACGSISAGGTLGILIPPSVGFILYGVISGQSIGRLFAAGILPGILLAISYMAVIYIQVKRKPALAPRSEKYSWGERGRAFVGAAPMIILFIVVIGGLFIGFFNANQASAVGAFVAFVIMVIKRKASLKNVIAALKATAATTGMVFLILIGAYCFGYFLSISTIPASLATWISNLPVSKWVILICIMIFYAFLGCLMDSLAMIILTVPIFMPVIQALGFDLIWYGVLMVLVMEMGQITPPVGINLFVLKGCAGDRASMGDIIKGAAPHLLAIVFSAAMVMIFPVIATVLPNSMYG